MRHLTENRVHNVVEEKRGESTTRGGKKAANQPRGDDERRRLEKKQRSWISVHFGLGGKIETNNTNLCLEQEEGEGP